MKVCIIGNGAQGTGLACMIAQSDAIESIVLADYNLDAAKKAAERVKAAGDKNKVKKILTDKVNASDTADIARAAKGCGIIFNATIPIYNIPIMEACLQIGAHYLDLLSLPFELPGVTPEETVDGQLKLHDRFKAAGLTAIPNAGMSPGWTDLAAAYICEGMDSVDTIFVRWTDTWDSDELICSFSPGVMFGEWFGPPYPLAMENGEPKEIDLLASEEVYSFPDPVGDVTLHTVTVHPEIVTFSKFINKPIYHVEEKGGMRIGKYSQKDWWIEAIRRQTSTHAGKQDNLDMIQLFGKSFIQPTEFRDAYEKGIIRDGNCGFSVEAVGIESKTGNKIRHTVYNTVALKDSQQYMPWASMGTYATSGGVPTILTIMVAKGEITQRGVIGVATLKNREAIFKQLIAKGQVMTEKIERKLF